MLDCREVRTDFDCDECYELTVNNCDEITIDAGLDPDTSYYLVLFDQFDLKRTIEIETDNDGIFTIDQSLLPDSYFNPYGAYDFYVSTQSSGSDKVDMTFEGEEFNCVIIIISNSVENDYADDYVENDYVE